MVPYKLHTTPTNNGIHLARPPRRCGTILSRISHVDTICQAKSSSTRSTGCLDEVSTSDVLSLLERLSLAERALRRLDGAAETASGTFEAATRMAAPFKADRERITAESDRAGSALRVHDLLQQRPYVTGAGLAHRTGLSAPTVNAALADLERLGVVEEVTGRRQGRVLACRQYLAVPNEGTTPLSSGS